MTPYEMDLLIHFYTTPEQHKLVDSDHYAQVTKRFLGMEVVRYSEGATYQLTELGVAWLKSALSTPLPTSAYVDSNGEVINID